MYKDALTSDTTAGSEGEVGIGVTIPEDIRTDIIELRRSSDNLEPVSYTHLSRGGASYNGSEQHADRPAVVVSNNKNNENSNVVEVVYMTTQPKTDLPTHVTIRSTGRISTVLCEQVYSVSTERIGTYIGEATDKEMENIDIALMISLQLDNGIKTAKEYYKTIKEQQEEIDSLKREIETMQQEHEEAIAEIEQDAAVYLSLIHILESADMLRIIKGGEEMFVGYLALFAPEVGHTNCKLYEQYKFDKVVKFRAVPEITHRKWKELNLMSPLRPDETPDFKFQELQMKLYYTIYL